mgnify:CR=1 FL=1
MHNDGESHPWWVRLFAWILTRLCGARELPLEELDDYEDEEEIPAPPPRRIGRGGGVRDPFAQFPEEVDPTVSVNLDDHPPVWQSGKDEHEPVFEMRSPEGRGALLARATKLLEEAETAQANSDPDASRKARAARDVMAHVVTLAGVEILGDADGADEPEIDIDDTDESLDPIDPGDPSVRAALAPTDPDMNVLRPGNTPPSIWDGVWDEEFGAPIEGDRPPVGMNAAWAITQPIATAPTPALAIVERVDDSDEDGSGVEDVPELDEEDDGEPVEALPPRDEPDIDRAMARSFPAFSARWQFNLLPRSKPKPWWRHQEPPRRGFLVAFAVAMVVLMGWFTTIRLTDLRMVASSPARGEVSRRDGGVGAFQPLRRVDVGAYATDDGPAPEAAPVPKKVAEAPTTPPPSPTPAPKAEAAAPTLVTVPQGTKISPLTGPAAQREIDRRNRARRP